ncbi:MAG TPA: diaminopimelate decarboxylase, partial [bacterium]|nr:diaminopimelate decarboxylase [bacterium]
MERRLAAAQSTELLLGEEQNGEWVVGGVGARRLAREFGTPVYVMDEARLRNNCRAYVTALRDAYPHSQAIFASKALCCMATCRLAYDEGMGVDVVSAGEIHTALRAGVPAHALMLHGSNKTKEE